MLTQIPGRSFKLPMTSATPLTTWLRASPANATIFVRIVSALGGSHVVTAAGADVVVVDGAVVVVVAGVVVVVVAGVVVVVVDAVVVVVVDAAQHICKK